MTARNFRKTIFCDIDGTLFHHQDSLQEMITLPVKVLPGVNQKFKEWREKEYYIVLTTARPEGTRVITEQQLLQNGIFFDQLVMGLPVGCRVVVNDRKTNGMNTADAVCIDRNEGLTNVEV